jgi:serine/threonine-protein kinase
MGEVYRARDTQLNRDVAIKILPEQFAQDPDRLSRFQREAEVLASLNHPNIAHIYGVQDVPSAGSGRDDRMRALVLEFVDGPTLADRIAQGPIPIAEAIPVAGQICEALESAHDRGIIHRDLKPANVKVTPDGVVKVLDFGLAKALEGGPEGSPHLLSQSPTLTSPAMTRMGIILGTAVYMSPEQAKGRPADKRSDVWSFGCVLYEMLTGKRAFDGEDLTDTIAAVVRGEPDWTAIPSDLPAHVRMLLKGCLEKDRKARISNIAVVRFLLDKGSALWPAITATPTLSSKPSRWPGALNWSAALAVIALTSLILWRLWDREPTTSPLRLSTELGADVSLTTPFGAAAVISPDGSLLAFVANKNIGDLPALYLRRLDQLQASMLEGTGGAHNPFFSPDGRSIGFFAQGKLKKIAVTGGPAVTLCDAPSGRGASWADDGSIIFVPDTAPSTSLHQVSSEGGKAAKLVELAEGEITQRWPQALPGGKAVLFTSAQTMGNFGSADIVVQTLPSGPRKILVTGAYYGRYVRSGHLLYVDDGIVFAAPFDLDRLELTGPAVPAIEGASASTNSGGAQVSFSDTGTLVYVPGRFIADKSPIRWLDRTGKTDPLRAMIADWSNPSFAPDGRKLAIDVQEGSQADVWIYDWQRDTLSRLTFDKTNDQRPVWTPDGRRLTFASRRGDQTTSNLYWQRADGTGEVQRLTESKNNQFPSSWHPSGKFLAFFENVTGNGNDLMILPMEGDEQSGWKPGKPQAFLTGPMNESSGMFSPDGRWMAYLSNETGPLNVFVRPFPGPGGKWQISTGAGDDPTWSRRAPELFFLSTSDLFLMVVPYRADGESFQAETPVVWAKTRIGARPRAPSRDLDLHPDGKRFAVSATEDQTAFKEDKVVIIANFFDELRRIAPARE